MVNRVGRRGCAVRIRFQRRLPTVKKRVACPMQATPVPTTLSSKVSKKGVACPNTGHPSPAPISKLVRTLAIRPRKPARPPESDGLCFILRDLPRSGGQMAAIETKTHHSLHTNTDQKGRSSKNLHFSSLFFRPGPEPVVIMGGGPPKHRPPPRPNSKLVRILTVRAINNGRTVRM